MESKTSKRKFWDSQKESLHTLRINKTSINECIKGKQKQEEALPLGKSVIPEDQPYLVVG
jgi:hypothetical protein